MNFNEVVNIAKLSGIHCKKRTHGKTIEFIQNGKVFATMRKYIDYWEGVKWHPGNYGWGDVRNARVKGTKAEVANWCTE